MNKHCMVREQPCLQPGSTARNNHNSLQYK